MTLAEEIIFLKNQIQTNQACHARCVKERDNIGLSYLEQRNRELIDRLNLLEDKNHLPFYPATHPVRP